MPQERVDPLEKKVLRLVGTYPEHQPVVARILEEGATPRDLLRSPSQGIAPVLTAILIRALRPPFKLKDNTLLGPAEIWNF